ncbi:hypothetical protein QFC19_001036 [Naganishia cerealis]|uniref:Uncharacterized protein n=1 Tax=Naganishia cerealis TaxID=610337 RepID=A0ACC2WM86_9TREE|nr:hypothetical protein QFC19_001036 [Naganishia cerealis]
MPDWRKSYVDGTAAYKARDFARAIRLLNEALNLGGKRFCVLDARAATFEKLEEHDKALKDCRDCIVLEPKSNKGYFRAARICEIQKLHEKALKFLEHGIQVTPPSQVNPYLEKLAALEKVVQRSQPQTIRVDPMSVLPEELLAHVFEMAIEDGHPDMAIRLSWVSRGWREMTLNCPFLWRRLSLNGTKYSQSIKRIRVFGDRGQGKLNHIRIDSLPEKDIPQFANALRPFLRNAQSLSIRTTFGLSLDDFIEVLQNACHHLEVLSVHVETDISRLTPPQELHLGLSATSTESRLRSIKLAGVTLGFMAKSSDSVEPAYDRLKSLVLDQCKIVPTEPAYGGIDTSTSIDVVQSTIRRANNLEHLEIRSEHNFARMPTKYLGSATRLEKLKLLVIPAPDAWAINIETPQLRKLAISNVQRSGEYIHNGLLPSLKQLAPLQIPVAELETLEVVVDDHDNQAALRSWLMRLANVKELAIVSQTPYQENAVSWVDIRSSSPNVTHPFRAFDFGPKSSRRRVPRQKFSMIVYSCGGKRGAVSSGAKV